MPLQEKHRKWLEAASAAAGKRIDWARTEGLKSARLAAVREELAAMKDELRELNRYEAELKRLLGTKTIDSLKGTQDGWNPNAELDTGRDVKRMAKALPPEVLARLQEAQQRILALQDRLLHAVPPTDHTRLRAELERRFEAAKQEATASGTPPDLEALALAVRKEVAAEFGCSLEEVDEIRLAAEQPAGLPKEYWPIVRRRNDDAEEAVRLCKKDLERAEEALQAAAGKPLATRRKLDQSRNDKAADVRIKEQQVAAVRDAAAQEFGTTRAVIDSIIGWQPCFTDLELRNELWKPLVREGVIPDNVVPDRYNETAQVFAGANELYQDRLNDEFYGQDEPGVVDTVLAESKYAIGKAADVASAIVKAAGGPDVVGTIVDATKVIAQGTLSTVEAIRKKELEGGLDAIGEILGQSVDLALGGSTDGKALAGAIKAAYKVAAKGAVSIERILNEDPPAWKSAVKALGEAIVSSLELCGSTPEQKKQMKAVGEYVKDAFVGAVSVTELIECMRQDPPDIQGCVKALGDAADRAFSRAAAATAKSHDRKLTIEGGKLENKRLSGDDLLAEQESLGDGMGGVSLADAFASLGDVTKATKALRLAEAAQDAQEVEDELKAWRTQLVLGFGGDGGDGTEAIRIAAEKGDIDRMIARIQRDRALIKMAEQIFSAGVKTAAQFFAPLRMADHAKEFVKQMIMAVRRAVELAEWIDLNRKALVACSVQGFAFANRVLNLEIQVSRRTLDAVMELTKLVGAATETAGQFASGSGFGAALIPVGRALEHGAQAAQALADVVYSYTQKAELARQWRKYLACLDDPYNRAQMRDVIAGNPTLSKYAMAYAAIEEDDVIAKEGMRTCGLDEAALKNPGTNAKKVVAFLETKFNDDPQLLRQLQKRDWQAAGNDPTMKAWMANKQAAVKELKLANAGGTGAIEFGLTRFQDAQQALERARYALVDAQREHERVGKMFGPRHQALATALGTFERQAALARDLGARYAIARRAQEMGTGGDDFPELLANYARLLRDAVTLGDELRGGVQKEFAAAAPTFAASARRFEAAVVVPEFAAVRSAADTLGASLRAFKPVALQDGKQVACTDFTDYCKAVATLADIKATNLLREEKVVTALAAEAKEMREEAEAYLAEIQGERFRAVATAVGGFRTQLEEVKRTVALVAEGQRSRSTRGRR